MLELNGIMKSYGTTRVLDDVTFQVAPGKLTGFVGGNGAGKTTTMRIILGVLARDGARSPSTAGGHGGRPAPVRLHAASAPQFEDARARPHVYLARLHGFSSRRTSAQRSCSSARLGERLQDNIETLSLGNQQRADRRRTRARP